VPGPPTFRELGAWPTGLTKAVLDLYRKLALALNSLIDGTEPVRVPSYTAATVPAASAWPHAVIYVSNETGGATLAFSDGTDWRRTSDRAVIA
jgi:hypothetical protein